MTSPRPRDASRDRFIGWVRDHHAAVFQSAWRITRNSSDADDVAQEVFLRVLESPDAIAGHAEPGRALRWIAVKTALTFRRGADNRRRREEEQAMRNPELQRDRRADDDAARREQLAAVREQVAALPEELRLATVLRFQEGLTFAAMAELEEVSEPTMFERVKRALEKLRGTLKQAGHAAALADLERLLAVEEVAAVPPKLAATLLALGSATSWVATLVTAAVVVVALAGGGALAVRSLRSPPASQQGGATPAVASAAPAREPLANHAPQPATNATNATAERALETSAPPQVDPASKTAVRARDLLFTDFGLAPDAPWDEAFVETGHLRGIAVDDDGRALAHANLDAMSSVDAPKGFRWRATEPKLQTAGDGSFDLCVAVVGAPQHYLVAVTHPDTLPLRLEAVAVQHEVVDLGRVCLRRNLADRAGNWTMRVNLVDADGHPVKGAGVRLYRRFIARSDKGEVEEPPQESAEAGAVTDELGNVDLSGTRVGRKTLEVYARFLGLRDSRRDFEIAREGPSETRIAVERGLTLKGRLVAPAGCRGAHLDAVPMAGADSCSESFEGQIAADGTFLVIGLEPGAYRLRISGDFSPAWLDDVAAGRSDVEVVLKRADDPRDVGVHRAEVHGRIVAAADGRPVVVDPEAVRALAIPADWRADDPRILAELVPGVQTEQISQTLVDDTLPPPKPSSDFHVTGLDAGSYVFLVVAEGYAPGVSRVVAVREREIAADVVVALRKSE